MKHSFKILLTYLFIFLFGTFYSQKNSNTDFSKSITESNKSGFIIINNTQPEKEAFYISAIKKADMEQYRLKGKEVILKFDNGFECVLISAKQLFIYNNSINPSQYADEYPIITYILPTFSIADNGMIKAKSHDSHTKSIVTY